MLRDVANLKDGGRHGEKTKRELWFACRRRPGDRKSVNRDLLTFVEGASDIGNLGPTICVLL